MIMEELEPIDPIAHLRFASVCQNEKTSGQNDSLTWDAQAKLA
jgi:transcriptional regulator NrdR family protein